MKLGKQAHRFVKNVEVVKNVLGKEMQNLKSIREMADGRAVEMAIWQTLRISGELHSVYLIHLTLLKNVYRVHNISEENEVVEERALQLTAELFKLLLQPFMDVEQIKPLVKSLNLNDTSSRMYFLTGLGGAVRKYPDEAFPGPESKQNLLQSVQDYLDEVILEEGR